LVSGFERFRSNNQKSKGVSVRATLPHQRNNGCENSQPGPRGVFEVNELDFGIFLNAKVAEQGEKARFDFKIRHY